MNDETFSEISVSSSNDKDDTLDTNICTLCIVDRDLDRAPSSIED